MLYTFTLTYGDGPLDITNLVPTFYLKATRTSADGSGTSFTTGSGITVVSAPLGKISVAIPRANFTVAGQKWYHIDVKNNALDLINTVQFGNLAVLAV